MKKKNEPLNQKIKIRNTIFLKYSGYFLLLGVILFLYFYVAYINSKTHWMVDDAFISFRYAKNLADGKGLVYNEGERVEGYTNFLWVLILSFFAKAGIDIVPLSKYLSFIFALLTIIITFYIPSLLYKKPLNPIFNLISCLFLASNTTFTLWILSGLETHLFLLLTISSIALSLYNSKSLYLPILIFLATLTRPEGILIFGITFLYKLILEKRIDIRFILLFLLLYVPYFVWRYSYYGFLFPNTFYAKVGSDFITQSKRGIVYTYEFLKASGSFLFIPAIFVFIGYKSLKLLYVSLMLIIFTLYIILVGGDCLPQYRFFLPVLPILYLFVQEGLRYMCEIKVKIKRGFPLGYLFIPLTLGIILFFIKLSFGVTSSYIHKPIPDKLVEDGRRFAPYILNDSNRGKSIALNSAGSPAYYLPSFKIIDMLGLNDVHIAHKKVMVKIEETKATGHERYDGAYVLSKKPDYIVFGSISNPRLMFSGDLEIFQDKRFIMDYEPVVIRVLTGEGWLFVYYRRIKDKPLLPSDYEGLAGSDYMEAMKYAKMMLLNKALYYQNKRDYNQAIFEFTKALKISPKDTKVLFNLSMNYYYQNSIDRAKEIFKEIINLPISDIDIYVLSCNNLGSLYYKEGLIKEASSCFLKTLKISPDNAYAKQMLGNNAKNLDKN
ncbi:MAG: hypothetical protein AB1630_12315 [bacterium]